MSLISPSGKFAFFNAPQGISNFGNAQVADPQAGKWTALVVTAPAAGPVTAHFQASTTTFQRFGTLSASSVTLPQGASKTFTLTVSTPAQPGDQAGSIILTNSAPTPAFARVTTVPVTLRSLAPTPNPSTTFTGTLTGGNGRSPGTGQTAYYQVRIPSGLKALNVSVNTGNPSNTLLAQLVDPRTGEGASSAFNGLLQTTSGGTTTFKPQTGAQLHVLNPRSGVWTLVVDFFNTVSGTAVAQPFTVTMNDTPVWATATRLPHSPGSKLAAGKPVTIRVRVTNSGSTPEAYFVDPRLNTQVTSTLATQTTSTLRLPNISGKIPVYLVPSHTSAIATRVSAKAPLFFDIAWTFGDPDLFSTIGKTATADFSSSPVAPGFWTVTPFLVGPTGTHAPPPQRATVSMSATSAAFDPTVNSPTGDLWLGSTNASNGFTPYVANPGQTITIPVTITPQGAPGTRISGTLFLDDSSFVPGVTTFNFLPGNVPQGSDVAAFPYRYTIKK